MEQRIFENLVQNDAYDLLRNAIGDTVKRDGIVYQIRDVSEDTVTIWPIGWDPAVHPEWTVESFCAMLMAYEERNVVRRWQFSPMRRLLAEMCQDAMDKEKEP